MINRRAGLRMPITATLFAAVGLIVGSSTTVLAQGTAGTNAAAKAAVTEMPPASDQQAALKATSAVSPVNPCGVLDVLLVGIIIGAAGQVGRMIVGIKKEMDAAKANGKKWEEWFDTKQLIVSLFLGAVAGVLYAAARLGVVIDKAFLLGGIAAGYAGADFIEGFMTKSLPASPTTGSPGAVGGGAGVAGVGGTGGTGSGGQSASLSGKPA